jgi:hypothetical protein
MLHLLLEPREIPQGKSVVLCLAIAGVVMVGLFIVNKVKKRVQETDAEPGAGFSLSDLRALHKEGKMTTEEFEKAKAKVVEAVKRANARKEAEGQAGGKGPGLQIDSLEGRDVP